MTDGNTRFAALLDQVRKDERARIRRLIGPALRGLRFHADGQPCEACVKYCKAIDAATKPEPKRKVKK